MPQHYAPKARLVDALRRIERSSETVDSITDNGDGRWLIVTTSNIETRGAA